MNIDILNTEVRLENDRVLLLPFENERAAELKDIIFHNQIWAYMGMNIQTELDFENYVANTIAAKKKGICYPLIVIDKKNDRVAGSTRYGYLNPASQKCEIGWTWYGLDFQGTGLNKACKYALLKFGFENIGFRRIQFSADQENTRSQRAIEKLGTTKEGVFRNNYIDADGQSRHDVYYSMIREEWGSVKTTYFEEFEK